MHHSHPTPPHSSPTCPFCQITSSVPPTLTPHNIHSPAGSAYVLLSTPLAIAILDIAPVASGHALLIPRQHASTLADLSVVEAAALGAWLPLLGRAVGRAVGVKEGKRKERGKEEGEKGEKGEVMHGVLERAAMTAEVEERAWNVVQANGAAAGQTVPHVHFHIIPRASSGEAVGESSMTDAERKNIALGEGLRVRIEREEGDEMSKLIRDEIFSEIERLVDHGELVPGEGEGELWAVSQSGRLKL